MKMKKAFILLLVCCYTVTIYAQKPVSAARSLYEQGRQCYAVQEYSDALDFCTKSMEAANMNADADTYNRCIFMIGNIYAIFKDYERSNYYFRMGYSSSIERRDYECQFLFACNIVATYCLLGDDEKAREYYDIQVQIPIGDIKKKTLYGLYNKGLIAQSRESYAEAAYYHEQTLEYAINNEMDSLYIITQYAELCDIALGQGKWDDALENATLFMEASQMMGDKYQLVSAYKRMRDTYKQMGDTVNEDRYNDLYTALQDTVFNRKRFNTANNNLFEYTNRVNQERIDGLNSRIDNQLMWLSLFAFFIIILCVSIFFIITNYLSLRKAQRLLIAKNEELVMLEESRSALREQYIESVEKRCEHMADDGVDGTPEGENTNIKLNNDKINLLLKDITTVMSDINIISQPNFTLNTLVTMVNSNTAYVSWVINTTYGKNFKALLNEYRIHEACRRLSDMENYGNKTIQAIYEELGYKSASNFIKAFKNVMGMTPSVYQNLIKDKE